MVPDTEPAVLLVGKMKGDDVYVKAQNAAPVFLVKKAFLDLVGLGVAGLRDKQILDFRADDAAKIVLKHGESQSDLSKTGNELATHASSTGTSEQRSGSQHHLGSKPVDGRDVFSGDTTPQ